uniref:Uncharacterized protein n=1 Tax=Aegilops tauschii subsp. strangulata TaxID=200361 RepID=A0A453NH67_AEGTS
MAAAAPAETMNKSAAGAEVPEAFTSVFQPGKLAVEAIQVDENAAPTPPIPVLIVAPKDAGTYPVAMLLHGFFLHNHFYEHLLRHVASHGFIIVAPQCSSASVSYLRVTQRTSPRQPRWQTGSPTASRPCCPKASSRSSRSSPWPATAEEATRLSPWPWGTPRPS